MGVTLRDHVDGSQGYELYLIGGKAAEKKISRTFRVYERHAKVTGAEVNLALDFLNTRG